MSKTSKYGKCIEQFDLKFHPKQFGQMIVVMVFLVAIAGGDGGAFGPYFVILSTLGLIGMLIFGVAGNCPGGTCLRACSNGLFFKSGFFSLIFLRWDQIEGFSTREKEGGVWMFVAVDESAGIGKEWEFSLELKSPADEVAARLTEIWNEKRSEVATD